MGAVSVLLTSCKWVLVVQVAHRSPRVVGVLLSLEKYCTHVKYRSTRKWTAQHKTWCWIDQPMFQTSAWAKMARMYVMYDGWMLKSWCDDKHASQTWPQALPLTYKRDKLKHMISYWPTPPRSLLTSHHTHIHTHTHLERNQYILLLNTHFMLTTKVWMFIKLIGQGVIAFIACN